TLRRAVAAKLGGLPSHPRHLLLHGWMAMVRGKLDVAHRTLDRAARQGTLEPRDEVVAAALAVGLARRDGDSAALRSAWRRARGALVRYPIDLYTLQPLGELAVAAARSGELESVAPHLKEAENLLDKLGNPVLWAVPLRWYELHAAIVAEQLAEAQRHAARLTDAASNSPYAAVLAVAADSWLQVLSGEIDPEAVQASARRMHGVGLTWDGAQLASQAAARTTDRRAMATLLTCARALNGSLPISPNSTPGSAEELEAAPAPAAASSRSAQARSILSEREIEVGQLILAGLTHKQVGERLFISAKTVEHHMARIRQRLGVGSRKELFDQLRSLIETP
ncbi:MAG: response regulator transcription factor, partial [Pseudonocardiaceae bacterium]